MRHFSSLRDPYNHLLAKSWWCIDSSGAVAPTPLPGYCGILKIHIRSNLRRLTAFKLQK